MRPRRPDADQRSQVSVIMHDELRERLEAAARRSIRSLAGEITYRLERSLETQSTAKPSSPA